MHYLTFLIIEKECMHTRQFYQIERRINYLIHFALVLFMLALVVEQNQIESIREGIEFFCVLKKIFKYSLTFHAHIVS